ncbi:MULTISPECIES: hypothetical protein [Pseudomonas]|jgi:hypothetical protein|uniref:Uncharacterized protein n=1 Tax=Pseudomonas fluorescens TaxID=294 RepID=A0A5E6RN17_PSEFL|nr:MULTISPECIES: hypothetical protein [Pseudomonas]MCF5725339.1 hypothetical protein [Pseudomonas syringae]VVM69202.1 hypothetical protein PS673_01686 [Pseudomonas fluorescens]
MTLRLNGWYRLWIVASVPLLVFGVLVAQENEGVPLKERLELFAQYGILPCAILYAMGWAVAWVIRGFKGRNT